MDLKIALVDDEQECLDELSGLIGEFGRQRCCHIDTALFLNAEAFFDTPPDGFCAVFMDIYMKGMDGVAAGAKLRRLDMKVPLVFLTQTEDFMPAAFSLHAFEYVLKPLEQDRIFRILDDLLEMLPIARRYIEVADGRKNVRVFLEEIASVVTDAHYLDITLSGGEKLRCRMTMAEFLELTERDPRFLPVNKGIAVNAASILGFEDSCCILEGGARFPIRVRDRLKIEQAARDYHFEEIRRQQTRFSGHREEG